MSQKGDHLLIYIIAWDTKKTTKTLKTRTIKVKKRNLPSAAKSILISSNIKACTQQKKRNPSTAKPYQWRLDLK